MNRDFIVFAFRRLSGELRTEDYARWADDLLIAGHSEPSIAELASYLWDRESDANQVEKVFQSCLAELGLTLPTTWEEALVAYTTDLCAQVIEGTLNPGQFYTTLLELAEDNNDPYILSIWLDLSRSWSSRHDDDVIDFNLGLDLDQGDECIRTTASQFIALHTQDLPFNFPWVWWCNRCGDFSDEDTWTEAALRDCPHCGAQGGKKNMRFLQNRQEFIGK